MKSSIVWEDCIQEEARVANREALLREDDQALAIHTKRRKQSLVSPFASAWNIWCYPWIRVHQSQIIPQLFFIEYPQPIQRRD